MASETMVSPSGKVQRRADGCGVKRIKCQICGENHSTRRFTSMHLASDLVNAVQELMFFLKAVTMKEFWLLNFNFKLLPSRDCATPAKASFSAYLQTPTPAGTCSKIEGCKRICSASFATLRTYLLIPTGIG